jgi:GNAT superfamily N-acetyltransferase
MEHTRPATAADVTRLVELMELAHAELRSERGGGLWARREAPDQPPEHHLREALTRSDALVQIGLIDDYTVGYGIVTIEPLRSGERLALAHDIYVEPPFRGVAIGEIVMDELIAFARRRGCIGIDSLVLPGMRDSKNFFERYGMKARALLVHKSFESTEEAADDG